MTAPCCRRAAVLGIVVSCICTHAAWGDDAARLSTYREQLLATSGVLDRVARQQRREAKAALPAMQVHVPPTPLGQAPVYSPSLDDWLQSNLAAVRRTKSANERARRLSALASSLRALAREPDAAAGPSADPKAQALDILAQRAYRVKGGGPAPPERQSWFARLWDWIQNLISELFNR
ncbi:MAG: hypothetical protein M3Z37_00930, partial [Candidatus Eremiobacteraeota bacterium]|nr:hypothetical protein [Candidatus Eremiobacteraeota bacterium]